MSLTIVNPLEIPNWDELVVATDKATFFHSSAWARVLHESYGYKPIYFGSIENGKLCTLMPFMEVDSWLTGKRGVSLPFTDECTALVSDKVAFQESVKEIVNYGKKASWKYIEWRDGEHFPQDTKSSMAYCSHDLYLEEGEGSLLSKLRGSNRRNIKKANKAGVIVEISHSRDAIEAFYRLHCATRKRHGLPPQPLFFFEKIFDHVISKGYGIIASATHLGKVISSYVFFHFGKQAIFKFGATDMSYQRLRPSNLIMWETIKWYNNNGYALLNFGRTEPDNDGLLQFKRGWGATERMIKYYRYDEKMSVFRGDHDSLGRLYRKGFARIPVPALRFLGFLLYKHIG